MISTGTPSEHAERPLTQVGISKEAVWQGIEADSSIAILLASAEWQAASALPALSEAQFRAVRSDLIGKLQERRPDLDQEVMIEKAYGFFRDRTNLQAFLRDTAIFTRLLAEQYKLPQESIDLMVKSALCSNIGLAREPEGDMSEVVVASQAVIQGVFPAEVETIAPLVSHMFDPELPTDATSIWQHTHAEEARMVSLLGFARVLGYGFLPTRSERLGNQLAYNAALGEVALPDPLTPAYDVQRQLGYSIPS
jgi:hypothetical protein